MSEQPKLLIGTPCYGGQLSSVYFHSILKLLPVLEARGIEYHVITRASESLIPRARNSIVASFLGLSKYTHLLFIDADMGFEPDFVLRLLDRNVPLAASACPMKGIDWQKAFEACSRAQSAEELKDFSLQFAVNILRSGQSVAIDDGFIKADYVGTAFMMIQRAVFEKMMTVFPECHYVNDIAGYDHEFSKDNFWAFFDCVIDPKTRRYLSEDYTFCHRWVDGCGGEISLDVSPSLKHVGNYQFSGSFLSWVQRQSRP